MNKDEQIARLEKTLDATGVCLRRGDFTSLAALTAEAEAGLSALSHLTDEATVCRLRDMAKRNAACLLAAARGMRAARRRLAEIITARAGLRTYNDQGQTQRILTKPGTLAQRF